MRLSDDEPDLFLPGYFNEFILRLLVAASCSTLEPVDGFLLILGQAHAPTKMLQAEFMFAVVFALCGEHSQNLQ